MKLRRFIKDLQVIEEKYGDLEVEHADITQITETGIIFSNVDEAVVGNMQGKELKVFLIDKGGK